LQLLQKLFLNLYLVICLKNRKSPGSDGFTVDFYKFFWKDIGAFVFRSLYFGYETGHFSQFQTQGVITCIPKESKDSRYMSNRRPISLLNTDSKIDRKTKAPISFQKNL
jgi:hypothetical protein